MKYMKKLMTLLAVLTLALAMAVPAFAETTTTTYTITINNGTGTYPHLIFGKITVVLLFFSFTLYCFFLIYFIPQSTVYFVIILLR